MRYSSLVTTRHGCAAATLAPGIERRDVAKTQQVGAKEQCCKNATIE